jgi:hypothetical protein
MSEKEEADIAQIYATIVQGLVDSQVIGSEDAVKELVERKIFLTPVEAMEFLESDPEISDPFGGNAPSGSPAEEREKRAARSRPDVSPSRTENARVYLLNAGEWDESKHSRGDNGKFGEGGGSEGTDTSVEIEQVIDKALNDPNARQKFVIGSVDKKLADAASKAGFSIDGYDHDLDVSGVRHAFLDHGNENKEASRGQIAITQEDIKKIPEVIKSYDTVEFPGKNKIGRDLIRYVKKMDDGTVFYVEEIRSKQKTLTIQTLWKGKDR